MLKTGLGTLLPPLGIDASVLRCHKHPLNEPCHYICINTQKMQPFGQNGLISERTLWFHFYGFSWIFYAYGYRTKP